MNRSQIEDAIQSGRPFTVRTADGGEFEIPTRDHIAVPPRGSYVVMFDDEGGVTSIPMLTMTSVAYRPAEAD